MGYRLVPTKTFEIALRKLDRAIAKRVLLKLAELENSSRGILPMSFTPKGLEGLCKYKVGEWRVFLWLDETKKEITLYTVKHRKNAYKNL
ncbi:MAG: type II toxin-antitoxin system RelE/ParE family toxin [bacterium]|nr:type II toxin-antitoxin system RelE/ParE family toxin [bacterium]